MRDAGFYTVFCGIETPGADALRAMSKELESASAPGEAVRAAQRVRARGGVRASSWAWTRTARDGPTTSSPFIEASQIPMLSINACTRCRRRRCGDGWSTRDDCHRRRGGTRTSSSGRPTRRDGGMASLHRHDLCAGRDLSKIRPPARAIPSPTAGGFPSAPTERRGGNIVWGACILRRSFWRIGVRATYRREFWRWRGRLAGRPGSRR
jgi:hypothetical protein